MNADDTLETLLMIARRLPDADVVVEQLKEARITTTATEVTIDVPEHVPAIDVPDGPAPCRVMVRFGEGEVTGEILLWFRDGRVSSAEHAWYTDSTPTAWPCTNQLQLP